MAASKKHPLMTLEEKAIQTKDVWQKYIIIHKNLFHIFGNTRNFIPLEICCLMVFKRL